MTLRITMPCQYFEWHDGECYYAECHYGACRYAECRGTVFLLIAYNRVRLCDFFANQATFENGNILANFFTKAIFYIFTKISSFRNIFAMCVLRFQKWFDVDVLGFQIELWCKYFAIIISATVLATSYNNWANLFLIFWSHWIGYTFQV